MTIKKISLIISSLLSVLFVVGIVLAASSVDPISGEVGSTATISFDSPAAGDYNITFTGNPEFVESIHADAAGVINKTVTIPGALAGGHQFEINTIPVTTIAFTVSNSKPVVGTLDIATAHIDNEYTGLIDITDANNDKVNDCSLTDGPTDLKIKPNAGDDTKCELYFDNIDRKPKSSDVGKYTLKIKIQDDSLVDKAWSDEKSIDFEIKDFIEIVSITTDDETGDSKARPGDTIAFKVKVKNNLDDLNLDDSDDEDLEDATITVECNDLDIEEEIEFEIEAGETETETIRVVIPYDTTEDDGPYIFNVIFRGEDGEGGDHEATDTETIRVYQNSHDIAITDVSLDEDALSCGDYAYLSFKVANIGENDEDDVEITIRNSELGIEENIDTVSTIDAGESKSYDDVKIKIPADAYNNKFDLIIKAKSADASKSEVITLTLDGCSASFFNIDSESINVGLGKETTVTISITNIGLTDQNFELKISGVSNFGEYSLDVEDEDKIEVAVGETKDVILTLKANSDAALDTYDITVDAYLSDDKVASKTVSVTLKKTSWLTGFAIFDGGGSEIGLGIGILAAIVLIGFLAYQIWFKQKKNKELEDLEKDESSIIFEDDESEDKPKKKNEKKRPKKKK